MSAITVGGDLVHYEVLGRGRQVILVHGWLGSWRYWVPTMTQISLKYRVYALDLFGFGDSGKNPEKYTIQHQVKLLEEFMNQMGLSKAAFIGHGLGALVLTEFALANQDKIARMLISNAPLYDPGDLDQRTAPGERKLLTSDRIQLNAAPPTPTSETPKNGEETNSTSAAPVNEATLPTRPDLSAHNMPTVPRINDDARARLEAAARAAAAAATGEALPPSTNIDSEKLPEMQERPEEQINRLAGMMWSNHNPLLENLMPLGLEAMLAKCFKTSEPEYDKLKVDVDKTDSAILKQSLLHYDSGRMLDSLRTLKMPIVVVHGTDDPIIPQPSESVWNYLTLNKEDILLPIPLPGVRHFPMLEQDTFQRLVNQFLDIADISKLEIKERWVRRTR